MNANKIVGGGTAGGLLAAGIVYLLGRVGVTLTAEDGALGASALVAVCAFITHNGLVGCAHLVWRGGAKADPSPPTL